MYVFGGIRRDDLHRANWASVVGVEPSGSLVSASVRFASPRPNPATDHVGLEFELRRAGPVSIAVHDVGGRVVRRITDAEFDSGRHALTWDRRDDTGRTLAAGLYFIRLKADDAQLTRKALLVR